MDTELMAELEALRQRDLETRERLLGEGRLYGTYDEQMQRVHVENAIALGQIVSLHGWPGVSKAGIVGCNAAWLIAQHAICTPALQKGFLAALAEAAVSGHAPMKQVALLTDRILFNENRPQIYGTVLDWNEDGELACELDNPEQVDTRRASVGLPPFQQSLHEHQRTVAAEGGKPPPDIQAYKKAAAEWATLAGWR